MKRKVSCLALAFFIVGIALFPARLVAAPYYEGQVMTVVVGFAAGTGYDRVARLVAKNLPNHIPGKPAIVVQNMPGAGSMLAANHLYNVAKPDGLTIGIFNRSLVFAQLLKAEGVRFDMSKFSWIGSPSTEPTVLVIRADHPCKTVYDVIKTKETLYIGGQGPITFATQMGNIDKDFLGLNIKMVQYSNSPEVYLAIERKELDGSIDAYSTARVYIDRGLVRPILRSRVGSATSFPRIAKVPIDEDLATDATGKSLMALHDSLTIAGRPFVAPPGTPADVAKILRDNFAKLLKDPQFRIDAEKAQVDLDYASAEECLKVVSYVLNQPEKIIKEFNKYVKF